MAQRVVKNVENDYLICSICLGRYDNPKLLPCGHTFCRQCLNDHITLTVTDRAASGFNCPNDRSLVQRPQAGLHPRQWADFFPTDTFLVSIIQAVAVHEGSAPPGGVGTVNSQVASAAAVEGGSSGNGARCEKHPDRAMEFFCLGCSVIMCPYCAVREHRKRTCECVTISEAMEKQRPRIQALKRRFENQIQKIHRLNRGEGLLDGGFTSSKERAQNALNEIEVKLARFYQVILQQVEDLRQQVTEATIGPTGENQQLNEVLANVEITKMTFENMCNVNTPSDILGALPKMEGQANEFDLAMLAANQNSGMQVDIVTNAAFDSFLRHPPPLGTVKINRNQSTNRRRSNRAQNRSGNQSGGNQNPDFNRQLSSGAVRPTQTPRQSRPVRSVRTLSKINVKIPAERVSAWHLTGITFVGSSVVAVDSLNQMVRQISLAEQNSKLTLPLEKPVSICSISNPVDVAVTQPDKRLISIISTERGLNVKEVMRTNKAYEGIAQLPDGNFVVSCLQGRMSIDMIDRGGHVLRTIERSHTFHCPRFLSVSSTGNVIVSDKDQNHVVSLNLATSQLQWAYSTSSSPWGVACDQNGKIFVCLDNNTVQVISEDGELIQDKFILEKDGIKTPLAICARPKQIAFTEFGPSLFVPNSSWIYMAKFS